MEKETTQITQQTIQTSDPKNASLSSHLRTDAFGFWLTILAASISVTAILFLSDTNQTTLRGIAGLLLTLWLPGYSLVKALFPQRASHFQGLNSSNWLLTVAFSVVFSIIAVSLIGLILDFTPWGVHLSSLALGLFFLTIGFSVVSVLRSYEHKTPVAKAELHVE